MSQKYALRVWKYAETLNPVNQWHNTYIVESDLMAGTAPWFDAMTAPAQGERHIHLSHVQFLRVDLAPVDFQGDMEGAQGFYTIKFEGSGIRDTQGHGGIEADKYALILMKMLTSGRNGHQVYRNVFYEGEVGGKDTDQIWWNASAYWVSYVWKWFRIHQEDDRIRQFVAHRQPGSDTIASYQQVYDWGVGTPTKLQTLEDAQGRKRAAGPAAHSQAQGAAQNSSYAWWRIQDAIQFHQEQIPADLITAPEYVVGECIATYKPLKRYFIENPAPIINTTRFEQPRADPQRQKAEVALTWWGLLEKRYEKLMERKSVDPLTGTIEREWVDALQELARECCAWANIVLYSRFT